MSGETRHEIPTQLYSRCRWPGCDMLAVTMVGPLGRHRLRSVCRRHRREWDRLSRREWDAVDWQPARRLPLVEP